MTVQLVDNSRATVHCLKTTILLLWSSKSLRLCILHAAGSLDAGYKCWALLQQHIRCACHTWTCAAHHSHALVRCTAMQHSQHCSTWLVALPCQVVTKQPACNRKMHNLQISQLSRVAGCDVPASTCYPPCIPSIEAQCKPTYPTHRVISLTHVTFYRPIIGFIGASTNS